MNHLATDYFSSLRGKRVAVLGIGVSNRPLIKLLLSYGISVTACDQTERDQIDREVLQFEQAGVCLKLGRSYLDDLSADIVFRTPGMHPDHPVLKKLKSTGCTITSEMEVFFTLCPCPIIGVTGSDGKTTTTTLISEILKHAGKTVWIGGNIGRPLLPDIAHISNSDIAVVELSSFQLMNMQQSSHISVVTNMSPNHLDVHKDMKEYIQAKENIFLHQTAADILILNADNEITAGFGSKAKGVLKFFSRKSVPDNGAFYDGETIWFNGQKVIQVKDILIPGIHNVENFMAAICAVSDYASFDDISYVARNFAGVEHRIEYVRTVNGVRYYNDSIASSPSRTIAGLHSFDQKVILIAGGYDKKIPFDTLADEITEHVKHLILCGATSDKIKTAVERSKRYMPEKLSITITDTLNDAVKHAASCAREGDIVTLSPACAAFDQFKNFMVRGDTFKRYIAEL